MVQLEDMREAIETEEIPLDPGAEVNEAPVNHTAQKKTKTTDATTSTLIIAITTLGCIIIAIMTWNNPDGNLFGSSAASAICGTITLVSLAIYEFHAKRRTNK